MDDIFTKMASPPGDESKPDTTKQAAEWGAGNEDDDLVLPDSADDNRSSKRSQDDEMLFEDTPPEQLLLGDEPSSIQESSSCETNSSHAMGGSFAKEEVQVVTRTMQRVYERSRDDADVDDSQQNSCKMLIVSNLHSTIKSDSADDEADEVEEEEDEELEDDPVRETSQHAGE